ncbi:TPA: type 3 fimbria chaperone MrkB [Klebsiella pneumoniae]|uniref:type 3 fimbria chaperone MrkB n=1 Tax=Klebsiella pneumoniae TaxID=573 RepID=UPI000A26CA74|nr:type 3 fimbria chaperone MrkB [Klebsiella pneumoniae]EKZ5810453.1 type 3 fimbria chaperone MrkB [Klebsiella pneumoniae]MCE0251788.1 type 3 fimbria chaperone MrkB [Klebsiella pneumoniae]MCM5922495.1 type 3 fimbria chaperone MrkB [Klebsiella pneumoniae]MDH0283313.1 type 3 fimbria chaperone MrkB [Klebsiella pneumoniae]PCM86396.1 molecular chaperone [Klebsiella pneumoniae]
MKRIALFFCFIFSFAAHANNIIVNGTRFIYPGNEKEITVQLSNNADRPALAQAWLDNGDADATPDTITTPFIITPPISRVDAKSGQTLRIKLGSSAGLAKDKETLWWLNLLEIPPVVANQKNEGQNVLQLAIRSRFKFIYRPAGLGNRDAAAEKLTLTASGSSLAINNPTPFYITVSRISRDGSKALNSKTVMLAPQSSQTVALSSAVNRGETLTVNNINDYGADVAVKVAVK